MGMGTVLLVVLVVGAAVFLRNRPQGSKASKPVESVSARPEEKRDLSAAPMEKKVHPQGGSRTAVAGPRLTAEQCRELARIHRQNMLDRQHDSRMSAATAVAGAVAGAALMHHHDAEAPQARLDQMVAAQRAQQQLDADTYDADDYDADDMDGYSDVADDYDADDQADATEDPDDYDADDDGLIDDGVDWDDDWSVDDDNDYGDGQSDYSDYGNDDYGSYGDYSGSGYDEDYGDYGGDDCSGGYDGGDYGGGDDYGGDDGGF